MIKKITHAVDTMLLMYSMYFVVVTLLFQLLAKHSSAMMLLFYSMYFVIVMLSFQLLAKHSSATLPCKRFVNKHL